jgi:hypothetical protein
MSFKDIALHVPIFIGQDFWSWKEMMFDYLGAQRLLGYALGQRQRQVAANKSMRSLYWYLCIWTIGLSK